MKEIKKIKNVAEQWVKLEAYYKTYYPDDLTPLIEEEYDYVFKARNEAVKAKYMAKNKERIRILHRTGLLRKKQQSLALQTLRNEGYKA